MIFLKRKKKITVVPIINMKHNNFTLRFFHKSIDNENNYRKMKDEIEFAKRIYRSNFQLFF